jgi:hypothetical protein
VYVEANCPSLELLRRGVVIPAVESVARLGNARARPGSLNSAHLTKIDFSVATGDYPLSGMSTPTGFPFARMTSSALALADDKTSDGEHGRPGQFGIDRQAAIVPDRGSASRSHAGTGMLPS